MPHSIALDLDHAHLFGYFSLSEIQNLFQHLCNTSHILHIWTNLSFATPLVETSSYRWKFVQACEYSLQNIHITSIFLPHLLFPWKTIEGGRYFSIKHLRGAAQRPVSISDSLLPKTQLNVEEYLKEIGKIGFYEEKKDVRGRGSSSTLDCLHSGGSWWGRNIVLISVWLELL